jgi:D-3-phosphoglycerate dehydrogenase / 2-oxoglutarate reductase
VKSILISTTGMKKYLIIDFDSTLVKVESLDELAKKSLKCRKNCEEIVSDILRITNLGMDGKMPFAESLRRRIELIRTTKKDIDEVAEIIKEEITNSISKNKEFFENNFEDIYIISGGFKELIYPAAIKLGIKKENILANEFIFDKNNKVIGIDESNLMSQDNGKTKQIEALNLKGNICVIGDGWTDCQAKNSGIVDSFVAFTENISRKRVVKNADFVANNFDEAIEYFNKI